MLAALYDKFIKFVLIQSQLTQAFRVATNGLHARNAIIIGVLHDEGALTAWVDSKKDE